MMNEIQPQVGPLFAVAMIPTTSPRGGLVCDCALLIGVSRPRESTDEALNQADQRNKLPAGIAEGKP